MDRGGLWYIKETTYALFLSIEEEIRCCLKTLITPTPKSKYEITSRSLAVRMCNIIATADFEFDRETHEKLLHMIVELYLTIRGYSYASAWMEKYKQFTKNGIIRYLMEQIQGSLFLGQSPLLNFRLIMLPATQS